MYVQASITGRLRTPNVIDKYRMSGEACEDRDQPFRDTLLAISKQLSEEDVEQLIYLTDHHSNGSCKPLELLTALRNKGVFSPLYCSPLADLLKKIDRHDLADEVRNKYVAIYRDTTSPPLEQWKPQNIVVRKRSATDPLWALTKSTATTTNNDDVDGNSLSCDIQDHTILGLGSVGGAGSLDNVYNSQAVAGARFTPRDNNIIYARTSSENARTPLRSTSRSSQDRSYASYTSSNSSRVSSHNSLTHESLTTKVVLERASAMLLDRVTSELSMGQLHQGQSSRSLHGPHTSNNHAISLKVTSHTLPPRFHHSSVFPASQEAIEPLSITDILSDNDEDGDSNRRSTLESPAVVDKRRNESANDLLCANQRMKGEEQTKTPRASVLKEDFEVTLHSSSPTSLESDGDGQAAKKEKNWRKRFGFFGKNKTKQQHCSVSSSFTWRVLRDDLNKPIWSHDERRCISRSNKLELDTNYGRRNPKLSFQLYPYGESEDLGEYVTMIVRINTSDKCPPLPPSSKVHITLTVRDNDSSMESILHHCTVEEHLDLGYFRIFRVLKHDQLMKSHSKYIYFDVAATSSGLTEEQRRLSTA